MRLIPAAMLETDRAVSFAETVLGEGSVAQSVPLPLRRIGAQRALNDGDGARRAG